MARVAEDNKGPLDLRLLMPPGTMPYMNAIGVKVGRSESNMSSMIPQHSDSRILEQLIYKWTHSRRVIADVLFNQYMELTLDGFRSGGLDQA